MHGDDMYYAFGDPFMRPNAYDHEDREMSTKVMKYWTDFARPGKVQVILTYPWLFNCLKTNTLI